MSTLFSKRPASIEIVEKQHVKIKNIVQHANAAHLAPYRTMPFNSALTCQLMKQCLCHSSTAAHNKVHPAGLRSQVVECYAGSVVLNPELTPIYAQSTRIYASHHGKSPLAYHSCLGWGVVGTTCTLKKAKADRLGIDDHCHCHYGGLCAEAPEWHISSDSEFFNFCMHQVKETKLQQKYQETRLKNVEKGCLCGLPCDAMWCIVMSLCMEQISGFSFGVYHPSTSTVGHGESLWAMDSHGLCIDLSTFLTNESAKICTEKFFGPFCTLDHLDVAKVGGWSCLTM